jgi:hypothetical protein
MGLWGTLYWLLGFSQRGSGANGVLASVPGKVRLDLHTYNYRNVQIPSAQSDFHSLNPGNERAVLRLRH